MNDKELIENFEKSMKPRISKSSFPSLEKGGFYGWYKYKLKKYIEDKKKQSGELTTTRPNLFPLRRIVAKRCGYIPQIGKTKGFLKLLRDTSGQLLWERMTPKQKREEIEKYINCYKNESKQFRAKTLEDSGLDETQYVYKQKLVKRFIEWR